MLSCLTHSIYTYVFQKGLFRREYETRRYEKGDHLVSHRTLAVETPSALPPSFSSNWGIRDGMHDPGAVFHSGQDATFRAEPFQAPLISPFFAFLPSLASQPVVQHLPRTFSVNSLPPPTGTISLKPKSLIYNLLEFPENKERHSKVVNLV